MGKYDSVLVGEEGFKYLYYKGVVIEQSESFPALSPFLEVFGAFHHWEVLIRFTDENLRYSIE
jgi:hypothetical protein